MDQHNDLQTRVAALEHYTAGLDEQARRLTWRLRWWRDLASLLLLLSPLSLLLLLGTAQDGV